MYPQRNPLAEASALSWRRCSLLLEAAAVSQLIPLSVTCSRMRGVLPRVPPPLPCHLVPSEPGMGV